MFCIYVFISLKYYILTPYKIFEIKFINKNACIERHKQRANPYFSTSKVQYYIFGASMSKIKLYKCLPIQIENLNLITNFSYCCFYGMLIACKCITFYKNIYCDVINEPPYLATTHEQAI